MEGLQLSKCYLTERESDFMRAALDLANEAKSLGEVPVGAVIVKDGEIISRGINRRETANNALAHAEIEAIDDACKSLGGWRLDGCEMYVTLEPCPMSAGAIINARRDRVVYGASDAKAVSVGSVFDMFELPYNHHPKVKSGAMCEECAKLLSDFFGQLR